MSNCPFPQGLPSPHKTKRVRAYMVLEGDTLVLPRCRLVTVAKVKELSKTTLCFDYNNGGFGIYPRRNYVEKLISL